MSRAEKTIDMPLSVWARAAFIAGILLAVLYLVVDATDRRLDAAGFAKNKATEYSNAGGGRLDAYFLGSSLTGCALTGYKSLDSALKEQGKNVHYKVVYGTGFSLQNVAGKIPEITRLRPRYLFIETNIACVDLYNRGFSKFRTWLSNVPLFVIRKIFSILRIPDKPFLYLYFGRNNPNIDFVFRDEGIVNASKINMRIRTVDEFPAWRTFFKQAPGLGIKVCLLEIPRSAEAQKSIPAGMQRRYGTLVRQYREQCKVGYVDFPFILGHDRYYLDRAHFSREGSYFYCTWLVRKITGGNI